MCRTRRAVLALFLLGGCAFGQHLGASDTQIWVGSKKFTESVILGEVITHLLTAEGYHVAHQRQLGGTRVLWNALLGGDIDVYPDYTGTLMHEILADENVATVAALREALAARGLRMTASLGFNNTYALGVRADVAQQRELKRISDLVGHPRLMLGFSHEFLDRVDGWPGLRRTYGLPHENVSGLDHDLAYRAIAAGTLDVIDVYATDAEIAYYDLHTLDDDRAYFPAYEAIIVYRSDLEARAPGAVAALERLTGQIDEGTMATLNARVKLINEPDTRVAADFLQRTLGVSVATEARSAWERIGQRTREHLALVGISLSLAIVIAVPLGIVAAQRPRLGHAILAGVGIVQTIPSLALFVFMIPLLGIGGPPALMALFLYSLLPIVRNTHTGLTNIAPDLLDSAQALGLSPRARLLLIELPLSARTILAGIKTSAVINVGTATLAALIGAGGYGQPILTGIRLDNLGLILQGAVPAALMALLAQGIFEVAERAVVPRGLRTVGKVHR